MDAVEVTWPTLLAARQQNDAANQLSNNVHTPAPLEAPVNYAAPQDAAINHATPLEAPVNYNMPFGQPNLYLQLSQILEWEIWNHNQTRAALCTELARRAETETEIHMKSQELERWKESCHIVYTALDEHRAENASLKLDIEALTAELRHRRELQAQPKVECSTPHLKPDYDGGRDLKKLHEPQLSEDEHTSSWRLGFIRDIDDHFNGSAASS
ncbi:hypothetical protein PtrEW4_011747 [Pyrenophora tritici-repentis]|uniref:Uncharacterized protein n=2 Tax=Pyrenophora tritici-repentis TaxID=45151 RepID=A0A922N1J2_9PLEO|nr:uncharacterized protein PTRG_11944 [Pyrenophora tritici-repentis Pt-1C-BFP]EDU46059.1 predicted protein [Pyrenophora tritici-repentis Pt-1C-BFP]KAI1508037.1 hypothetical protein Ptr86124_012959 [Pyrenophora tritici-repentis]KAI1559411.1 hypothetical protein PtrEW4_011747 [Pyrenophora tritici-repentis]KAI1690390.1 hypothetical protein KJE20_03568 [Pyrenophora tritici-repentis]